jgi:hypothetical protein
MDPDPAEYKYSIFIVNTYTIQVYYKYRLTATFTAGNFPRPDLLLYYRGFELFGRGHGHLATLKMVTCESPQYVVPMRHLQNRL